MVNGTQPSTPTHTSSTHPPTMQSDYTPKEFSILSYIDQNSDATQRQLSEHVGVSLGTINILIKRLVKKGLIKIDRLQPNSVKYFLTPAGIASKLERTYGYVLRTYRELSLFRARLTAILRPLLTEQQKATIWFFGPDDDFALLLKELLDSEFDFPSKRVLSEQKELTALLKQEPKPHLLTWNTASDELLQSLGVKHTNILASISVE